MYAFEQGIALSARLRLRHRSGDKRPERQAGRVSGMSEANVGGIARIMVNAHNL